MDDDAAWKKVGAEGYDLLVAKPDPDNCTFGTLSATYLAYGRTKSGRPKAHSTLNTEKRNIRVHLSHWNRRVAKDIRPAEVQDWLVGGPALEAEESDVGDLQACAEV
jgi:hypothetical protein